MSGGIHWPWSRTLAPVLQSEAAECGLASIVMVARHYGHRINLAGLRQRYPPSVREIACRNQATQSNERSYSKRLSSAAIPMASWTQPPTRTGWA